MCVCVCDLHVSLKRVSFRESFPATEMEVIDPIGIDPKGLSTYFVQKKHTEIMIIVEWWESDYVFVIVESECARFQHNPMKTKRSSEMSIPNPHEQM